MIFAKSAFPLPFCRLDDGRTLNNSSKCRVSLSTFCRVCQVTDKLSRINCSCIVLRMSSKRLESLADYARHGFKIRVDCKCGRVVVIDPRTLLQMIAKKGWSRPSLDAIGQRLKCQRCGSRPKRIGPGLGDQREGA